MIQIDYNEIAKIQIDYLFVVYIEKSLDDTSEFSHCLNVIINGLAQSDNNEYNYKEIIEYAKIKYLENYLKGIDEIENAEYDILLTNGHQTWKKILKSAQIKA